jgi:hypothetical protein
VVRRTLGRAIEDFFSVSGGGLEIGNPSEGVVGRTMASFAADQVPAPKPERRNTSVEMTLGRRDAASWQLQASYVWTNLTGNFDGPYQVSTGQLDPGTNSAYDYADFMVNGVGHLTSERKHQLKFDGAYGWTAGPLRNLTAGASFHWLSGLPLTAYGYSLRYANWEYYLTPRGSLGRGPSDYEANAQLLYRVSVLPRVQADLQFAVFNLLNRQAPTQLYPRYNEIADGRCAGIPAAICNGDNGLAHIAGTLTPVAQLANPRATATSPDFLKAGLAFTAPRSARLGLRIKF